jgi:hypothetical protein
MIPLIGVGMILRSLSLSRRICLHVRLLGLALPAACGGGRGDGRAGPALRSVKDTPARLLWLFCNIQSLFITTCIFNVLFAEP